VKMKTLRLISCAAILLFCTSQVLSAEYSSYKVSGGMSAHKIKSNVYEYHYDKGFVGPDAMGWDPNLQFAWSRIAAAKACGMEIQEEKLILNLIAQFQKDQMTHQFIGIGFHGAQIGANKQFCTEGRVSGLKSILDDFYVGKFPDAV